MKRSIYLKKMDWNNALQKLREEFSGVFPLSGEPVLVVDSLHRVTTSDVVARLSSPHYDSAAMDGIAVKAEMTFDASSSHPKQLKIGKDTEMVDTGNPIKDGFDSVIKIEDVILIDGKTVEIRNSVPPGKDIRKAGEDFEDGDCIIPANRYIGPVDVGAMLSCGVLDIVVRKKPVVSIIPTGSEIIEPSDQGEIGKIIDCNSYIADCLIREWGGIPRRHPIVRNDCAEIERTICESVSHDDVVIVIAGSSAGSEDYTVSVLKELGTVLIHGVDLMPGKPMILAKVNDKPIIGLPGYPVSAYVILDIYVREIISLALGVRSQKKRKVKVILAEDIYSKLGMNEVVRVRLSHKNGTLFASPLKRGAGVLSSLVKADGLLFIPSDEEGMNKGKEAVVEVVNDSVQELR